MKKPLFSCLALFLSIYSSGQIYTPSGTVSQNQSGYSGIGIGTNSSNKQLSIASSGTKGLLNLQATQSQDVFNPGNPEFAIRLMYDGSLSSNQKVFELSPLGRVLVGNLSSAQNINTFSSFVSDLGIYTGESNYLKFFSKNTDASTVWSGSDYFHIKYFDTSPNTLFTIKNNGNIGLNKSDPTATLHIHNPLGITPFRISNASMEHFTIVNSGNVGINLSQPTATLHINNLLSGNIPLRVTNDSDELMKLDENGTLIINNQVTEDFSFGPGSVYGLQINNNADAGHNYAIEVNTEHNKIFSLSNSGHMHLGPGLNFDIPGEYRLYVQDGIRTEKIRVDISSANGWADYVFEPEYKLMSIDELSDFIDNNGHLPGVPTAEEVHKNGIDLAEMNKILLEKIEELSLMIIQLNNRLNNCNQSCIE